jgi:hypothetical protein
LDVEIRRISFELALGENARYGLKYIIKKEKSDFKKSERGLGA